MSCLLTEKQKFILRNANYNTVKEIAKCSDIWLPNHLYKDINFLVDNFYLERISERLDTYKCTPLGGILI